MKTRAKRFLSAIVAIAMVIGLAPVVASATPIASVSTRMSAVGVRSSDDAQIYKLVFDAYSANGITGISTLMSWDASVIVPVDARVKQDHKDIPVIHEGTFAPPLEILLENTDGYPYTSAANKAYLSATQGRAAFQFDIFAGETAIPSMTEPEDAFAFYFRLADGKSTSDIKKGTFRIEVDKSPTSFLAMVNKTPDALAKAYGLKLAEKSTGDVVTHFYSKSDTDTLSLTLEYLHSDVAQLGTVEITNDAKTIAVPVKVSSPTSLALTTSGTDTEGDPYNFTDSTTYSLVDIGGTPKDYTGISIDDSDLVVTNDAVAGDIYIKAENEGVKSLPTVFTVTKDISNLVPTTIEVSQSADTLTVPTGPAAASAEYTAQAYDQYGQEIAAAITWQVWSDSTDITTNLPTGMTFSSGSVSVAKGYTTAWAEAEVTHEYEVSATVGTAIKDSKPLSVVRPESTNTEVKIVAVDDGDTPGESAATWIKPETGENTYTYYAYVADQYGLHKGVNAIWNDEGTASHFKTYAVGSDETETSRTVKASYAGLERGFVANIYPIVPDWDKALTVAGTGVYGAKNQDFVNVITPRTLDVTVAGSAQTVKGTYSVQDGDSIQGAGTRQIVVRFTLSDDPDNGEYKGAVLIKSHSVKVVPKPITVVAVDAERYYGVANPAFDFDYTPTDLVTGDTKATLAQGLELSSTADNRTAAGSTKDITGTDTDANDNYDITVDKATLTIDKAPITVTGVTIAPRDYDGTTVIDTANVTAGVFDGLKNAETLILGTDYTVLGAVYTDGADVDEGKPTTVTVALTASPKATNYVLTNSGVFTGATADVTPLLLTGTWSATDRPYSYGYKAVGVVFAPSNVVPSEDVGATGIGTFDSDDVAVGIPVTVSEIVLTGSDRDNYEPPVAPVGLVGNIEQATFGEALTGTRSVISSEHAATDPTTYTFDLTNLITGEVGFLDVEYVNPGYSNTDPALPLITTAPSVDGNILTFDAHLQVAGTTACITVTVKSRNYKDITATVDVVSVDKIPVTIAGITVADKIYDGQSFAYEGTAVGTDATMAPYTGSFEYLYQGTKTTDYSSAAAPTDAGSYKLVVSVPESDPDFVGTRDHFFEITKRPVTVGGIVANNKSYDGTMAATLNTTGATFGDIVAGDELTVTAVGVFADKNVGSNKDVELSGYVLGGASAANYSVKGDSQATTKASITRKSLTVSAIDLMDKVYDGTRSVTKFTGATLSGVEAGDVGSVVVDSITATTADKHVGAGKAVTFTAVDLRGDEARNYQVTEMTVGCAVNVLAEEVTVAGITAKDKVYDGTDSAALALGAATFGGKVSGDDLSLTATGTFDTKAVGDGKPVAISDLTLGGADAGNYVVKAGSQTATTANITPLPVTVTGITGVDRPYDGTAVAALNFSGAQFVTMVASDDLSVLSAIGVFADEHAGTNKRVTISGISFGGVDAANYSVKAGSQTQTTANITKRDVVVSGITAVGKVYDGKVTATVDTTGATFTGLLGTDVLEITATGTFADKNVGATKTVTLGSLKLGGKSVADYQLAETGQQATAIADITPKEVTVGGIKASDKKYDGTTGAALTYTGVTYTGKLEGDALLVTAIGAFEDASVGTGKTVDLTGMTLGGTDEDNYTLSATCQTTAKASVTKAEVTVASGILANDKTYDGTTDATLDTTGAALSGKVGAENLTLAAQGKFADPHVGTGKLVTISNLELGGTDAGNYVLAASGHQAGALADIDPLTISITAAVVDDKIYDGTTAATLVSVDFDPSGLVRGVDYVANAVFDDKAAGTSVGATVTVTLLNTDYTLTPATYATTAEIAKANLGQVYAPDQTIKEGSSIADLEAKIGPTLQAEGVGGEQVTVGVSVADDMSDTSAFPAGTTASVNLTLTHLDTNYVSPAVGKVQVTFTELDAQDLSFPLTSIRITYGDVPTANVAANNSAGGGAVTYASSDPSVATVASNGTLTVLAAGTTVIEATAEAVVGVYSETRTTYTLIVLPKTVTVVPVPGQSKTYGNPDPAFTYTTSPSTVLTGELGREVGEDAGSYAYTLGTLSVDALDSASYELVLDATDSFDIGKATYVGVSLVDATRDYTGAAQKLEVTGLPSSGVTVIYTYERSSVIVSVLDVVNAGAYSVTASFGVGPNYNPITPLTATLTVNKVTPTITLGNLNQELTANNITPVTATLVPKSSGAVATVEYKVDDIWTPTVPQKIGSYDVRAYLPLGDANLNPIALGSGGMAVGTLTVRAYSPPSVDTPPLPAGTTVQNPDGSVTTTTVKVTEKSDGSIQTVVTETTTMPDGSSSESETTTTKTKGPGQSVVETTASSTTQKDSDGDVIGRSETKSTVTTDSSRGTEARVSETKSTDSAGATTSAASSDARLLAAKDVADNKATAGVTEDRAAALLDAAKANERALADGAYDQTTSTVTIDARTGMPQVTSSEVTIPSGVVKDIAEETFSEVVVLTDIAEIKLDRDTLAGLAEDTQDDETISVKAEAVLDERLTESQRKMVGDSPVYEMLVVAESADGTTRNLGEFRGSALVRIPYTLGKGEDPANISVYFVGFDGNIEKIACRYVDGYVEFAASHFSYYAVVYEGLSRFTDVAVGDWFYGYVSRMVDAGLFRGMSDTEFGPDLKMTRAMLVTTLYRLEGEPQTYGTGGFADVQSGSWYTSAVAWAAGEKIVEGYGDWLFGTHDDVTREQLITILFRYAAYKGNGPTGLWAVELKYPDRDDIAPYAVEAAMWCQIHGIIKGFEDGRFGPRESATRAQVATILDRYMSEWVD